MPEDLPLTVAEFEAERRKAADKYRPLVKRLGSMDFLGLLLAVEDEVKSRNTRYKGVTKDPGTRLGNR